MEPERHVEEVNISDSRFVSNQIIKSSEEEKREPISGDSRPASALQTRLDKIKRDFYGAKKVDFDKITYDGASQNQKALEKAGKDSDKKIKLLKAIREVIQPTGK